MPGILPMKVIRVGGPTTAEQTRIAQAWYEPLNRYRWDTTLSNYLSSDRCRSKKIRCDGVRP